MASNCKDSPAAIFFHSLGKLKRLPKETTDEFGKIKDKFNNESQDLWSFPTSASISLLGLLNSALAECRILDLQRSIGKKTFHFFSPSQRNTHVKIKELVKKINEIIDETSKNPDRNSNTWARTNFWTQHINEPEADASTVLLFAEEEQKIINVLCGEGFKVIGIHGMCGSGKTVLVDKVLNYQKVRDLFSPIMKIRLSNMYPKEQGDTSIVKYLLEVLGCDVDESIGKNRDDDPVAKLKDKLNDMKFLIVLEDVWFYNDSLILKPGEPDGDNFLTRALPQDTGGAVIVTSRIKDVAQKIVGGDCLFHLKPWELKEGKCLDDVVRKNVSGENRSKDTGM